jgi:GntR family transcriptional regulator/MocR family aminotransferase
MQVEWTGLGPPLPLRLDRTLAIPLRVQLERALREAIRAGRLGAGERLPSSRVLARELGVSRGLVLGCYRQLQAEGFLIARPGSATRVASAAQPPTPRRRRAAAASPRAAIDFAPGVPDLTSFPRTAWAWALREACRRASPVELGYDEARGVLLLRSVLTAYLRRVRGALVDPDDLVVCAGFAQGLNLVLAALARDGLRSVALEDPGELRFLKAVVTRVGLEAVPVRVDERGIDVEALAASDAQAVILTPTHQSPTGVVLAPERRHALLAWARERDGIVIEDDYDAEFRYDREPVGALQGLDPERVVTIGTVSKSLAPALRLGWIVCPPALTGAVAAEKQLADRGSPGIDQLALARLIESGRYDRHLRHMRALYARRRETLLDSLARHAPHVRITGLVAGFHAVAHLPDSLSEHDVVLAARSRSVGLYGMSRFRANRRTTPPQLVLGFGNLNESAIDTGISKIADVLKTAVTSGLRS